MAETYLLGEVATFLESLYGFAREAHDDVGGEVEVGAEDLDALAHVAKLVDGVEAMHPFQSVVGTALQADVHVWGEFLVLEELQETVAELVGLDGRDAHAEVTLDVKDVFHELLEVGALKLVTPHVDARQHDFLEAVGNDFAHIIINVLGGTARRAPSHHGDDAVGTEVVAAIVDFDEAAGVESVEGRLVAEQVTVVAFGVAVAGFEMLVDDVEQGSFALVVDDIVGDA